MADQDSTTTAAQRRNRVQLLVIVSIAVLSLGGSYALFYLTRSGISWGTTNHGEFVSPPVTVVDLAIRDAQGQPVTEGGTWWLWVVPGKSCDESCDAALHQLRQLHALLNKDASRVRRALVRSGQQAAFAAGSADNLAARYPKLQLLSGQVDALRGGVYIVDPIGNLVFRYELSQAGKPVLEDLKKLLKVSQIG